MTRIALLASSLLLLTDLALAAVPMQIPLQGALRDNAGAPVSEGTFEMTFTLYTDAEGTESAWTTTRTVEVQGGIFRTMLGEETPVDAQLFSADGGLWLGVTVEAEPELPLRPLASTPYALAAGEAAGLSCSGCVSPEALSAEALETIRTEAVAAGAAAGFATNAAELAYDDETAAIGAATVQTAIEQLKGLIDEQASGGGPGNVNEGAGTISRIANQWGLPSYGTATEYVHLMNPNPPKMLLHLYGGENTGFASSNNLIVSNTYSPNAYSGGANGQAGTDSLTVTNAGAFNDGDHILIYQTVGNNPGHWELNAVKTINGNSLKLAKDLTHTYIDSNNSTERAQVVIAASYNNFEVINGGHVTPGYQLDGSGGSGGIVYIRARQISVKSGGKISANGDGFRGEDKGWDGWQTWSQGGDSECNTSFNTNDPENNCSGGGAGYPHSCCCDSNNYGAGGGGNRTPGTRGKYHNSNNYDGGKGGAAKGDEAGTILTMGGSGGYARYDHRGGDGGGLIVLGAETIVVESGGVIESNGNSGVGGCHAGGGGGAGGSIAMFADNFAIEGTVQATGGDGGNSSGNADGGAGGEGWILQLDPIPGVINQSYATDVEIWIDGQEVTPLIGDPNGKGSPHWDAEDEAWGATGTEPWSSGPLDITNVADWTLGEHTIEFKETGGAGGDLKAYLYMIQTFTESTPPVNDTCTSPVSIDLSEGPVVLSGTTEDVMGKTKATDANSVECGGAGGPDVTYRIDLSERALINVATVSPFPMRMYLREGDCSDGEVVYCADGDFSTTPFEPGTYFLVVDSDNPLAKGDFTLAVSLTPALLPDNDTCDTAMELFFSNANIATDAGSTLYSLDQHEAWCGGAGGPEVVYKFTAPSGYKIDILVDSDEFDPILALYRAACGQDGILDECIASNVLSTNPQPGSDYWLVIDSAGEGQWGAFDLTVSFTQ